MNDRIPISIPNLDLPGTILRVSAWHCRNGVSVRQGEPLVEIAAGDVIVDLSAPADGVLHRIASEDNSVEVGQVIGKIQQA